MNADAIERFLQNRQNNDHSTRLIKKKDQIYLVNKKNLSICTRFKAQIGCGKASFRKISSFVNKHQNTIFNSDDQTKVDQLKQDFNKFVDHYNCKRRVFWKTAKKIEIYSKVSLSSSISEVSSNQSSNFSKRSTNKKENQAYLDEISENYRSGIPNRDPHFTWFTTFGTLKREFAAGELFPG